MTITVKQLKEALERFRDDAVCHAYEGEVTGIVICLPDAFETPGVIHCHEGEPQEVEIQGDETVFKKPPTDGGRQE
jgi:hypothetical protein